MAIEKSCRNCRDNDHCSLYDKIEYDPALAVECKLEEGIIDGVLQEELDLTPIFAELQHEGTIKKNINIKSIDVDKYKAMLIEQISHKVWDYIIVKVSDIEVERTKMTDTEFYCSEWR
jgi:hypothetical protein